MKYKGGGGRLPSLKYMLNIDKLMNIEITQFDEGCVVLDLIGCGLSLGDEVKFFAFDENRTYIIKSVNVFTNSKAYIYITSDDTKDMLGYYKYNVVVRKKDRKHSVISNKKFTVKRGFN